MKTFNDLTLKQYREYMLLEDKSNSVEVVKILIDNWRNKSNDEIQVEFNHIINTELTNLLFCVIEIDGKLYGFNKKKLSFGEFVDLQNLMDGNNFWNVVEKILQIYFRPIKKISRLHKLYYKLGMWMYNKSLTTNNEKKRKRYLNSASQIITTLKYELEEYNPDESAHTDAILNMKMGTLYGATLFFWTLMLNFSTTTLNSLQEEMKEHKTKVQE